MNMNCLSAKIITVVEALDSAKIVTEAKPKFASANFCLSVKARFLHAERIFKTKFCGAKFVKNAASFGKIPAKIKDFVMNFADIEGLGNCCVLRIETF